MSGFTPYPAYKDSGVEWLGKVPAHWVVGPLRWYATIQGGVAKGKSYSNDTPTVDLPYLRVANVQDGHVDLSSVNTVTVALSEVDRYRLQVGDVLMNEGGDNDKLGRGTVWQGEIADCLHQNHVFAIRPNYHLLPYWLSMFTRSSAARSYFYLYSKQSTNLASISSSNVMSCPLPLPPAAEQRQILNFLDHETARIDALVEEQQRLIGLLKEKRQAVISHAVTKGLDSDVPMKDSGVEWLGEVPAHWKIVAIKWLSVVQRGASPRPIDDPVYFDEDGEYGWVRIADVSASNGELHSTYQTLSELGSSLSVKLEPEELFVSIAGTVGKPCITKIKACIHDGFVYFPELAIDPHFLFTIFESGLCYKGLGKMGTQLNLNTDTVGGIKVALPSESEIEEILSFLDDELKKIDQLSSQAQHLTDLLSERRSALISAAVTGKIDVRGWQANQQADQSEMMMAAEARATYG